MTHKMEFDSIQLSFGQRVILSDIFIRCETGKIVGLLGRNGAGKTCLFRVVYGDLPARNKSVRFDSIALPKPFTRPEFIKYLPQFNFIPKFLSIRAVFQDADLNFSDFIDRFPEFRPMAKKNVSSLSGGQRRFLETYIIVKSKTQFVLLDEPFTHLMPLQIEKLLELLFEEKRSKGFIITDHLYGKIIQVADELYLLKDGKTHFLKTSDEIERFGYINPGRHSH
jgi:ABC-type multidrug transport system ATPase subunit